MGDRYKQVPRTVIPEIFVAKNYRTHQRLRKLSTRNIFNVPSYYVTERELNYHRVRNFFNTNILRTNTFNMKIFQTTVASWLATLLMLTKSK